MSVKIRTKFRPHETVTDNFPSYVVCFLSDLVGVVLVKRGADDNHVCFDFVADDAGCWFPYEYSGVSAFWLPNYIAVLEAARAWLNSNAKEYTIGSTHYGWTFNGGVKELPWSEHAKETMGV